MLIPINREKFEQLIPRIATGPQYNYCWGKARDFLTRLLISVIGVVVVWVMHLFLGNSFDAVSLMLGVAAGFYWLWGPIYWASRRNSKLRNYKYSGFWQGQVLDIYVTEELTREEEDVNKKGELVIIENRERRLNIEVGDETGFRVELQVPLKRTYKQIARGQTVEMLVVAHQPNLNRLEKFTDLYLPERNLWVSDYPYLQQQIFEQLSQRIGSDTPNEKPRRRSPKYSSRYADNYQDESQYDDPEYDNYDNQLEDDYRGDRLNPYLENEPEIRRTAPRQLPPRKSSPPRSQKRNSGATVSNRRTPKRRPRS
jgi:hypothetical protein